MVRSDIVTRVRDYIYEDVADKFTDVKIQRFFLEELRSLPSKGIYLKSKYPTTFTKDVLTYALPAGTSELEGIERNYGTVASLYWDDFKGYEDYGGSIYLDISPSDTYSVRLLLQKAFTEVTDDSTPLDIPDDKSEVLVWGIVVRCYKALIGYLKGNLSWDSVTAPRNVTISSVQAWLRDAQQEQKNLIQQYRTQSKPREIDLVS